MKKVFVSAVVAMMLISMLAGMALAAPSQKEMLLKGSWDATESVLISVPSQSVNGNASGNATQLGKYTAHFEAIMQSGENGVGTATANISFRTSDGDTLYAQGVGLGASTDTPGVSRMIEAYTITGGTGKFVGATGSFTVVRFLNLPTGISTGAIQGSIVYP